MPGAPWHHWSRGVAVPSFERAAVARRPVHEAILTHGVALEDAHRVGHEPLTPVRREQIAPAEERADDSGETVGGA